MIILWATAVTIDIVKIIVNLCVGFSIGGHLPLYVCSLFMYVMPFAIWGKGVFKNIASAYVCTLGLFGAIGNYVTPSVVTRYSIFSFYGFHTTLYHTLLLIAPFVLLCTGYFRFRLKEFGWLVLGFVIVTIPVVIFNYIADTNYMYFNTGIFIEDFAAKMGYFWPFMLYIGYAAIMITMQLLIMGITKLVELLHSRFKKIPNENE